MCPARGCAYKVQRVRVIYACTRVQASQGARGPRRSVRPLATRLPLRFTTRVLLPPLRHSLPRFSA